VRSSQTDRVMNAAREREFSDVPQHAIFFGGVRDLDGSTMERIIGETARRVEAGMFVGVEALVAACTHAVRPFSFLTGGVYSNGRAGKHRSRVDGDASVRD
jgi:hypothetical protein